MNFNFPPKEGTGIDRLIPNAPAECVELVKKLLAYNPDDRYPPLPLSLPSLSSSYLSLIYRLSARQALRHSYFRDLREGEKCIPSNISSPPSSPPSPFPPLLLFSSSFYFIILFYFILFLMTYRYKTWISDVHYTQISHHHHYK